MRKIALVPLPHGIPIGSTWLDHVSLREINGHDEQMLSYISHYPSPFKTTALLGRVLKISKSNDIGLEDNGNNDGEKEEEEEEVARKLTVGDRIALILHLRKLTFGDKLQSLLVCPNCKASMSLDLSASNLLQPPEAEPKMEYVFKVEDFTLNVRPLTGADLEFLFAEPEPSQDKEEGLARRCIISSKPALPDRLSVNFLDKLASELEDVDRQATMILDLRCPDCQHSFQTPFNAESFLYGELETRRKQLEREVHWLAFNYHWTEDAILSLSVRKRKRYVDLVNSTLAGESI